MPLYNGSNTAAGMYAGEEDNSFSASSTYPSTGAMVGVANRGPVGIPYEVLSKTDWRAKFGRRDASVSYAHFCAERFLDKAQRLWFVRVDLEANYGSGSFRTVNGFSTAKSATKGYLDPATQHNQLPDEIVLFYAANPGAWNNSLRVLVYPDTADTSNELFVVQVFETSMSNPVETYRATLRDKTDGTNKQLNIEYQLELNDSRIRAKVNTEHPEYVSSNGAKRTINAIATVDFLYGDNGRAWNNGDIISAWDLFDNEDDYEIRVLINAGYTDIGVHNAMLSLAEERRDCFAILDVPSDMQTAARAVNFRRNLGNYNTSFGALYANDIEETTDEGQKLYVPSSGAIAAVYATSDAAAAEWWAPAGVIRGLVDGITGLRYKYSQNERNLLDQNQINYIHKLSGYGYAVWGAQTLQALHSALSDIPVRRLINTIETTAKYDALRVVFDPNDEYLWKQLENIVRDVLDPILNGRGLYYYDVKCDGTLNKSNTIATGDVILVYVIEPVRYTKRILFTTTVAATGQLSTAVEYVTKNTGI